MSIEKNTREAAEFWSFPSDRATPNSWGSCVKTSAHLPVSVSIGTLLRPMSGLREPSNCLHCGSRTLVSNLSGRPIYKGEEGRGLNLEKALWRQHGERSTIEVLKQRRDTPPPESGQIHVLRTPKNAKAPPNCLKRVQQRTPRCQNPARFLFVGSNGRSG